MNQSVKKGLEVAVTPEAAKKLVGAAPVAYGQCVSDVLAVIWQSGHGCHVCL